MHISTYHNVTPKMRFLRCAFLGLGNFLSASSIDMLHFGRSTKPALQELFLMLGRRLEDTHFIHR